MFENKSEVEKVLVALGEHLDEIKTEHIDLLVCGGSALHILGLITRPTTDVDIVALVSKDSNQGLIMSSAKSLPDKLTEAAKKVERDFSLKKNWLNSGPTSALDFGLPEGVLERAETINYGSSLTVRFLSRYDQIHFKLYAATDRAGKHYEDLLALKPTAEELEKSARWSMTHDVSEGYRGELKKMLIKLGYKDVSDRI